MIDHYCRIASELKMLLPEAGDEELYQSTRRIVVAEMQNVVYGQWLREMLGKLFLKKLEGNGPKDERAAIIVL